MSISVIEDAIYQLIIKHRGEFDHLVAAACKARGVLVDLPTITMDSIQEDNLELWTAIADSVYPSEDLYEGLKEYE